jgi:hypothetical protein
MMTFKQEVLMNVLRLSRDHQSMYPAATMQDSYGAAAKAFRANQLSETRAMLANVIRPADEWAKEYLSDPEPYSITPEQEAWNEDEGEI